ncbi:MAG: hypothetical protein LBU90_00970 [Bacteroidales bacterium]|jgi:hypothetical protein|nr:hypothetical protein [Bacteroidales bacterium]
MKQLIIIFFSLSVLLSACSNTANSDSDIVARFGNEHLYKSEIETLIPAYATAEDSVNFIRDYIRLWGMNRALYAIAQHNVAFQSNDIEKQVEQFRADLYISKYEDLFAQQKLDTIITITQLDTYYATHKQEFILQFDVVKPFFAVLPKQYVTQKLRQSFTANNVDNLDHLIDLTYQHSTKFYLGDKWVNLDQLKEELPTQVNTQDLLNPRGIIIDFENDVYFIKISNYIQAGKSAPRDMVYEKIAANLLYKRRIEVLNTMRTKVYQDALRKNELELFFNTEN